ncbi:FliM/FliN family flagellar motor switch protein [Hyphomicrobium facile]|uniref:Flagellar motor switch protein FliM n=1 Tax=Hyphomicrobium facile TaxID=51670 RepID=A0A1I7NRJ3_9HYPH|nr:FliM/FliN family flagellar motor switch protein [Hyphomicrobium facile]SFV37263.1 flagellar motor switch protein FliM [Hyphomicrobium facile]
MSNSALSEATAKKRMETERSLERALSTGQNSPDRLPGLQMIFGQLPRVMTEEIGNLSLLPLKVRLLDLSASTIGDICALPQGAFAGVVRAERWRSWLYFLADPAATTLFVEAATGCEGFPPGGLPARKPTRTDANVLRVLFRRVARALTSAFSILVDVGFDIGAVVEKIELEPQLTASSPVIAARLSLDYGGHIGVITIVIPQAALDPIRHVLAGAAPSESLNVAAHRSRDDPAWSKQLSEEIARSFIELNGVLEERPISLGEVQRFAVGSVVELQLSSMSRVRLDADESPVFWCELGKRDNALILRVDDEFDQQRETVDEYYGL